MKIFVTKELAGRSVYSLLRQKPGFGLSYSHYKSLKQRGRITVNGAAVTVRFVLSEGDALEIDGADDIGDTDPFLTPIELPVDILYEDDDVTLVNKAAGMPTHTSHGHQLDTLANALAFRYRGRPYVFRPVNRLDRNTSGIVLTANSRYAASVLSASMVRGKIRKLYAALLEGVPDGGDVGCVGTIRGYIRRENDSLIKRAAVNSPEGADLAVTKFVIAAVFDAPDIPGGRASLVVASPLTGRTHQLRVHFAHAGAPIAGDDLYGGSPKVINRQALHAFYLAFPAVGSGESAEFFAPVPDDFKAALRRFSADAANGIDALLYNFKFPESDFDITYDED